LMFGGEGRDVSVLGSGCISKRRGSWWTVLKVATGRA
jgi:hypothetical protein